MNKSSLPAGLKDTVGPLLDDHRKVEKLFKDFEKAESSDEKKQLARTACHELTVHAGLEEAFFYPAVRKIDPEEFGDMLDEAKVEHAGVKSLVAQIESMKPEDDLFDAKVTVLSEYVKHHVKEEEDEMFAKLVAKKCDLRTVGEQMEKKRAELGKSK